MTESVYIDAEYLVSSLEKLPLFARTLIYLASAASRINDRLLLKQFADTGLFFKSIQVNDEGIQIHSEEWVS